MVSLFSKKKGFKKRGACSLVFDDGYTETLINVLPILKKYRIQATFAFATNPQAIEKTEKIPCAKPNIPPKIKTLGHEIASHTVNHQNLTLLDSQSLNTELKTAQEVLGASTLIYPGGTYNEKVINCAKQYYQAARGVEEGLNDIPPQNFYNLKTFVLRQDTKWFLLNHQAHEAHRQNKWLIESYHLVSAKEKKYRFTVTPLALGNHGVLPRAMYQVLSGRRRARYRCPPARADAHSLSTPQQTLGGRMPMWYLSPAGSQRSSAGRASDS